MARAIHAHLPPAVENDGEIRMYWGDLVEVLRRDESGWTKVQIVGNPHADWVRKRERGWVPDSYLRNIVEEEPGREEPVR